MRPLAYLLAAVALPAFAAENDQVKIERDIDYLGADRTEKADLYSPATIAPGQRCPAVVIIHGGGWSGGDKGAAREINIGTTLAQHGCVGLSINYALATKEGTTPTWPQNLHDCKTAVRWLRKNAERLHIDPDHIGSIGGSAGGHLSAMLALTGPSAGLDPAGPYGEFSCQVQCSIDLYGPVLWFEQRDISMFRKKREEAPELYRQANPLTYVTKILPPIMIMHGTADTTVSLDDSKALDAALEKVGANHQLVVVEGAPHTFHLQPKQQDLRPIALGFFDKYLKPAAAK